MLTTILLHALLIDAAAETFVSGSPVRWVVLGITAANAVATALLSQRTTWRSASVSAFFVLIGTLAVTAWLPGGLTVGMRLLGLSTPRLLCLAAAAGVALAAVALSREPRLPRAVRVTGSVLAAYGVVAFLHGMAVGAPFASLMTGGSLWRILPFVLHGAVLGGLLVLPAAVVVSVVGAGVRQSVDRPAPRAVRQGAALATSLAIVLAGLVPRDGAPVMHISPRTDVQPTTRASDPAPVKAQTASAFDPRESLARADRMAARTPRAEWDVAARAAALGPGVMPAFAFVRDTIRYEAYAGVLRGAPGAYAARAGNALDRALLLARLLEGKGPRTRFAIGALSKSDGERLFARTFEATAVVGQDPPDPTGNGFYARVFERAKRDHDIVRAALGDRLPPVTKPSREDVLAEMNPHVWVQAEVDGQWTDLDPSFADATPGHAVATLERTVEEIPGDMYQRIGMRVIAEQLVDGVLVPSTLLELSRNAVAVIDRQIVLFHSEPQAFKGIGFAIAGALGGANAHDRWTPAIVIDGESTSGTSLDTGASTFVAERLEFDLSWPNGRHEVTRRLLVDRGSAAWRAERQLDGAALRPLDRGDAGPFAMQAIHNVWFSAGRHNLANFTEAVQDLAIAAALDTTGGTDQAGGGAPDPQPSASSFGEDVWPFALQNFAWMIWTDHVVLPALNDTPGARLYADGARIAVFTRAPTADGGLVTLSDLRRDDLRGVAVDASAAAVLAEKKLRFGLLQGALEQEALADFTTIAGADPAMVETTSAALTPAGVVVLPAGTPLSSLPVAPHQESAARLAATTAAGSIVVAPVNGLGPRGAWWEIAAGTGDTRAIGDLGLHAGKGPSTLNPFGGSKTFSARTPKQINDDIYQLKRLRLEKKAAQEAARYAERNALSPPAQRGGGSEYAVLIAVVTVVGGFAMRVFGLLAVVEMYTQAEQAIEWFNAHR